MKNSRHYQVGSPALPPSRTRAFTLIEVLIVTIIMALLSVALALSYRGASTRANFSDHKAQIFAMMQEARGRSLSNLLIDTDGDGEGEAPTYYYLLAIGTASMTLTAYTETSETTEIESFEFDDGFEITSDAGDIEIYYFPPYGEICFDLLDCSSSDTEKTFTFSSPDGQSVKIMISAQGGYPEVVE